VTATAAGALALVTVSSVSCSADHPAASGDVAAEAAAPEAAERTDAATIPTGYDGGVGLGLVDVPDTPCARSDAPLAIVLAGAPDAAPVPSFRSLHAAGARLVADTSDRTGFAVFDPDGKNATLVTTSMFGVATTTLGDRILAAGNVDVGFAAVQAYDASGRAIDDAKAIAFEEADGLAVGVDDHAALVVWGSANAIRARGFAAAGAAGDGGYDLAVGASAKAPSIVVSSVQSGLYAVVFSGNDNGTAYQTAFGRGSTTARVGDPSNLFTGAAARTVVGLTRTPAGFAVLVTVDDAAEPYAMLVLTDAGGHKTSAGLKLVGTVAATGVAVNGSEIGVLARRRVGTAFEAQYATALRTFDLAGGPVGPWVCLDAAGGDRDPGGGLVADGTGYAALFRSADGNTSLARLDHVGTGAP
jgi:hypothetical protein